MVSREHRHFETAAWVAAELVKRHGLMFADYNANAS
jgi:hypothetical protein